MIANASLRYLSSAGPSGMAEGMQWMTESERARFELLLEDLHDKVTLIAEGHQSLATSQATLVASMGRLEASVSMLTADVAVLKTDVAVLKTDVAVLKTDMADIKPRVARIEHHLGLNGTPPRPRSKPRKSPRRR
jgi:hypothetical protein